MQQYGKYIFRQLAHATLLIALCLTSIVWLSQALRFVDYIVNRGVSLLSFLHLTALIIPSLFIIVLPFAVLIAVLYTYQKMTQDSELLVLTASGLSRFQIAKPALQLGAIVALFGYFLTLYLLPLTYNQFREMQNFLRDNYASLLLQEEVFNSPVEGLTVFVRERESGGVLRGILVHDNRVAERPITMLAQEGRLVATPQGPRFILISGSRQEMRNGRLSVLDFDRYLLDLSFYATKQKERRSHPNELYLDELFSSQWKDKELAKQYRAEGHQRLIWPLYPLGLTMLALGVLLSTEFNRRTRWQRAAISAVAGVVILALAIGVENMAASYAPMVLAMYAMITAVLAAGVSQLAGDPLYTVSAPPKEVLT